MTHERAYLRRLARKAYFRIRYRSHGIHVRLPRGRSIGARVAILTPGMTRWCAGTVDYDVGIEASAHAFGLELVAYYNRYEPEPMTVGERGVW